MMPSLAVGLIGCGRVAAAVHLPVLQRLRGVRVVALAEPDDLRRNRAASQVPGVRAVHNYRELLEMPDVDAVVICVPNEFHAVVALDAIERGKHLYVEKPLALRLEDVVRLVEARDRAGVVGMMGFNQRFNGLYRELRQHIANRPFGEWLGARTVLSAPEITLPDWKRSRLRGGGALLDQGSHHIDLVRYVFDDEITEVSASVRSQRSEDDTATVNLRMKGGLLIQSFLSIHSPDEDRLEVFGERGTVAVDRFRSVEVEIRRPGLAVDFGAQVARVRRVGRLLARRRSGEASFVGALTHFVESVQHRRPASPGFEDGARSLAVVLAAEESARSGCVVRIDASGRQTRVQ